MKHLLRFDFFRVVQDRERHLTPATRSGAVLSTITLAAVVILVLSETISFFTVDIRSSMFVDKNEMKLETVHFNMTFTEIHCHHLVMEAFDPQTHQALLDQMQTVQLRKERTLKESPSVVLGDYVPALGTNTEEGCRVSGSIKIDKVPGNFYIAARNDVNQDVMNVVSDHIIHEFWLGDERLDFKHDHIPEAMANALGGLQHRKEDPPHTLYQYFLQVVPTYFRDERTDETTKIGYQYTATFSKAHADNVPPGVYFRHQHTPFAIEYRYRYQTWSHFLVHVSAVVGGVYTVVGFGLPALDAVRHAFGR